MHLLSQGEAPKLEHRLRVREATLRPWDRAVPGCICGSNPQIPGSNPQAQNKKISAQGAAE